MESEKRNRAREAELKAQRKFNEKFNKTTERKYEKRAFFRFWTIFFDKFNSFMGINMFCSIIGIPMVLLGYMMMQLIYSAEYEGNGGLILPCIAIMLILGVIMGAVNAASVYIMRCHIEGKHVTFFSDFFGAFKSNFKQSIPYGIGDALLIILLFSVLPLIINTIGQVRTIYTVLFCLIFLAIFVYYSMRVYSYLQMVTINLKLSQINRNSLFFVVLGVKNNILNAFISVLTIGGAILATVLSNSSWVMMAVLFLVLFIGVALIGFVQVFCAYPVFYKHLIEPELAAEQVDEISDPVSEQEAEESERQYDKKDD